MNFWKNKNVLITLVFISVVVLFIFWELPKTFYQQDEWVTLGWGMAKGFSFTTYGLNPLQILLGEGRVFTKALDFFLLTNFRFNIIPIYIFAVSIHIFNTFLVFKLTKNISKNNLISFIASVFFSVNSVSSQAVTWAATIGSSLPSTTLILLSVIFYFKFIEGNKKYLYLSFITTLLSLFFKETGLFLFILLPLLYWFNKKNIDLIKLIKVHSLLLGYGLILIFFRLFELFFNTQKVAGFVGGGQNFLQSVLFHLILYPLTSLLQIFVPPLDLYSITPIITKMQYKFLVGSPLVDLVAQSIVADTIAILGSIAILVFFGVVMYKNKDKTINRNILFALIFFFLTFIPYVVLDRDSSYLSSRYFYLGAVPAGILFGYAVYFFTNINKYVKWIVLLLVTLFLFHHASIVRGDISYQVNLGNERKAVLIGIKNSYPTLADKNMFYVTSDKQFYGDITNPFQNGLGYVLEVYYYDSEKIPKEFLTENFLWDLGAEGYKEKGNSGFGYFQDMDKMVLTMEKNKLSKNIVHGFFFDSKTNEINDITNLTRERLATISAILK